MADIVLAANNADVGGGEQMLLRHAVALLELGHAVTVVAADSPSEVLDAASAIGVPVVAVRADSRSEYLRRLRAWDRTERTGFLWCHGLVPAIATAGRSHRVVHLHQLPRSRAQWAALTVARIGADRTLTPSAFLAREIRGSEVCANWTDVVPSTPRERSTLPRVGFMGRLSSDKGADLVARALTSPDLVDATLVVAGDGRWVPDEQQVPVSESLQRLGDRLCRLGRVSPSSFFAEVDVAVFPSRVAESFGLVVAEAMAAEVPFVVSDAGALPEVAGPDHPWVARRGDADDLSRVLTEALSASDETRRAAINSARVRWLTHYSPDAGRRRIARLLDDLGVS